MIWFRKAHLSLSPVYLISVFRGLCPSAVPPRYRMSNYNGSGGGRIASNGLQCYSVTVNRWLDVHVLEVVVNAADCAEYCHVDWCGNGVTYDQRAHSVLNSPLR